MHPVVNIRASASIALATKLKENLEMIARSLFAATAVAMLLASPALALDCQNGEGRQVELDFKKGSDNTPLVGIGLRPISEKCVVGPSVFTIVGVKANFASAGQAESFVKASLTIRPFTGSFKDTTELMNAITSVNLVEDKYDEAQAKRRQADASKKN